MSRKVEAVVSEQTGKMSDGGSSAGERGEMELGVW